MKYLKYIFVGIFVVSFFSCEKDAPTATNEPFDRGHEIPQKIILRFSEGKEIKTNGERYFETIREQKGEKLNFPIVQEYIFENTEDGVITKNDKPITLEEGKSYSLEIFYYNIKNDLMNYEFTTPEMAPIHQHFFRPRIKKNDDFIVNKDVFTYHYRDTQPYNKMLNESSVFLRKENDPIGLKGYFTVNQGVQSFDLDLEVVLVHVIKGNKLDDNGNPYPFHSPSDRIYPGVTDLDVKIPIKIFTSIESPNYKEDISKEFNIPLEDVEKVLSEREKLFKDTPKVKF